MRKLKLFCVLYLFIQPILNAAEHCGSKQGFLNELAAEFLIPDYFPPEAPIFLDLFSRLKINLNLCEKDFGNAWLGKACLLHDHCYENSGTSKLQCDLELEQQWILACNHQYKAKGDFFERFRRKSCQEGCKQFVKMMAKAQTINKDGFCPSCDAYEDAQRRSSTR